MQLKEDVHRLRGERDWKESLCLRQDEAWAESQTCIMWALLKVWPVFLFSRDPQVLFIAQYVHMYRVLAPDSAKLLYRRYTSNI